MGVTPSTELWTIYVVTWFITFWNWKDNLIVLFELWGSILKIYMFYCKNWPCDIVIKLKIFYILFVVFYSQCNVLTGHHCVVKIIWSVLSWYLYHLSFQKTWGCLTFFFAYMSCIWWLVRCRIALVLITAQLTFNNKESIQERYQTCDQSNNKKVKDTLFSIKDSFWNRI